jgi:hypothetical protein
VRSPVRSAVARSATKYVPGSVGKGVGLLHHDVPLRTAHGRRGEAA